MYYAYAKMSATKACFLLNQEITNDPKMKQHPEVLFHSTALPAQFVYVYPYNSTPYPPRYLNPYSTISLKYLGTCFVAIKCTYLSSTMN
jgi:hypothetical protein